MRVPCAEKKKGDASSTPVKRRRPKCLLPYKISPPELVFGKLPSFRSVPSLHRHFYHYACPWSQTKPIAKDRRTVACPFMHVIDYETFAYRAHDEGARESFDWELYYKRLPLLPEDLQHPAEPFKCMKNYSI
ncbi:N-acetylgalactosaminyltransferase 6 [Araneus ventricosus]|uniref:N-acetylgalactosaminyltransferase 6 n=1 Tax=Araneus ventricosus TaxID=182803 RepID=A0A4Y2SS47_ARAVE|nr:N-acetylgalactosaminyltransferase 6 [Araneus ventricosus]